jgi:XRE family transcriptional regulator, regulator of sulfur utilization
MATRRTPSPASSPKPPEPPPVGARLAALRNEHQLSLDELSRRAGVSKSMLSQIERAQANPTVAVVWRLSHALGVPIGDLLGSPVLPAPPRIELVTADATPSMGHPDGSVSLRILGPIDLAGRFEWYELQLRPAGALVSQAHEPGSREHLTVQAGALEVTAGQEVQRVRAGETARYAVDQPHAIRNTGKTVASALLAVVHSA